MTNNVMVCVTQQKTCERLIKQGELLNDKLNGELFVIHVAKEGTSFLGNHREADAIEYLYEISKNAGADMTILRSQNVVESIIEFVKEKNIKYIVLGEPPAEYNDRGIVTELKNELPSLQLYVIPSNELK